MIPLKNLHTILRVCFTLSLFFYFGITQAQNAPAISNNDGYKGTSAEKVKTKFIKPEIEIKKSGLISNVLKIINTNKDNLNFTLDVLIPNDWNSIINPNKTYSLKVNDTLVIPVIIDPSKLKSGNSEVIINSFIIDLDGQQIGDNSFIIKTKKQVKWDIDVKTANRFYFKNDEFNKKFEYRFFNFISIEIFEILISQNFKRGFMLFGAFDQMIKGRIKYSNDFKFIFKFIVSLCQFMNPQITERALSKPIKGY